MIQSFWKTVEQFLRKLHITSIIQFSFPIPLYISKRNEYINPQENLPTFVHSKFVFNSHIWKYSKYPLVGERINKLCISI